MTLLNKNGLVFLPKTATMRATVMT